MNPITLFGLVAASMTILVCLCVIAAGMRSSQISQEEEGRYEVENAKD